MEISDRMYPDRNWRVFYMIFPGMERNGDLEIQRNTVGTTEGCMIKERNSGKFDGGFSGSEYGDKQRN